MSKILIVGNSHVAAVQSAWHELQSFFRDIDISFLAAPLNIYSSLTLSPDRRFGILDEASYSRRAANIVKQNSGGYLHRDFNDFDHVAIVGARWGLPELLKVYSSYLGNHEHENVVNMQSRLNAIFLEICRALVDRYFHETSRFACGHPSVHIVPAPRRSERLLPTARNIKRYGAQQYATGRYKNLCNQNGIRELMDLQSNIFVKSVTSLGITCHPQPDATIGKLGFTDIRFSDNPKRLQPVKHVEIDNMHMNSEYGALFLRDFLFQTSSAKRHVTLTQ